MATVADLRALGYTPTEAFTTPKNDGGVSVYLVEGFGVRLYVRADDSETLAALAAPDAHAERARQYEEGPELPPAQPDPPTVAERIADILLTAPELTEDTRGRLRDALEPPAK